MASSKLLHLITQIESSACSTRRHEQDLVMVKISLPYIVKRMGPGMDPCGTPDSMVHGVEVDPITLIFWVLQLR